MRDAEVDREIIPGAPLANRATLAGVSPHRTRMKTTNTDFDYSSLVSYGTVSVAPSHQTPHVMRLLDPVLIAADRTKAELIGTCRQRLNVGDQLPSLFL